MIHVAFVDSDRIGSRLIRLATWSDYSHVALVDGEAGTVIDSRFGNNGVTEYPYERLLHEYPRITLRTFPTASKDALWLARSQIGKHYDYTALFGLQFHRDWQDPSRWFCSELVAWACEAAGTPIINKQAYRVTPQDLWEVSQSY